MNLEKSWLSTEEFSNMDQEWQMNTFEDRELLVHMFYEKEHKVTLRNTQQINSALLKNTEKIAQ